jgi:transposase
VARLKALDPEVRIALEGAEEFAALVRQRNEAGLGGWLNQADAIPTQRAFAMGLRRDEAAVRAGLTLPWSNGPVEGAVNRLKLLKRAGYGRAKFDLLRARVLHRG